MRKNLHKCIFCENNLIKKENKKELIYECPKCKNVITVFKDNKAVKNKKGKK